MNIYTFLRDRPLSYSAINTFSDPTYGSPEKWYRSYILGERQSSAEMTFGSKVDLMIQNDLTFCPTLPRYPLMQHKMSVMFNKNIPMTGTPDGIDLDKLLLADYKTGRVAWTQEKADHTDQLTCYLFFAYITHKIDPSDFTCYIHWLPTVRADSGDFSVVISFRDDPVVPITFTTYRTMEDILTFGGKVIKTVDAMQKYLDQHQQLAVE